MKVVLFSERSFATNQRKHLQLTNRARGAGRTNGGGSCAARRPASGRPAAVPASGGSSVWSGWSTDHPVARPSVKHNRKNEKKQAILFIVRECGVRSTFVVRECGVNARSCSMGRSSSQGELDRQTLNCPGRPGLGRESDRQTPLTAVEIFAASLSRTPPSPFGLRGSALRHQAADRRSGDR